MIPKLSLTVGIQGKITNHMIKPSTKRMLNLEETVSKNKKPKMSVIKEERWKKSYTNRYSQLKVATNALKI